MAITLSTKYISELAGGYNTPNVVVEFELDSGTRRFASHSRNATPVTSYRADGGCTAGGEFYAVGTDELPGVEPVLKSVSSLQNKLDPKSGFSTRGRLKVVLAGRDNFAPLVRDEYLKNRRVTRRDGFISSGFTYADYAPTFTGRVLSWSRKGDELTVEIADDMKDASTRIPLENDTKTQYLDYSNANPVDIIKDILTTRLGISDVFVDTAGFDSEKSLWLGGVRFHRVLTEPKNANEYLNELQVETNSFIVHDGEKVSFKVFAPPGPGVTVEEWTDDAQILAGTFKQKSGYTDGFFNRIVIYYDYDESGDDKVENYDSAVIAVDAASQSAAEWNEVRTKVIKSRWIRGLTFTHTANIGGLKVYHVSRENGSGPGTLTYSKAVNTLTWTPPGGFPGEAVKLTRDGKYKVRGADETRYVRVLVSTDALPATDAADDVTITALDGAKYAATLATRLLNRYRSPVSTVSFEIDINSVAFDRTFIKPTDLKDLTTGQACEKDELSWDRERVMITAVRPDFSSHKVLIEAIETKMYRRYGFIAPAGLPDYTGATEAQKEYAFVGDGMNKTGAGTVDGYYIW